MTLDGVKKERPLTHDLIGSILLGLGASLDHIVINDARDGTFFARIILRMENELGKKIVELDARPERFDRARAATETPDLRRPVRSSMPSRT
jgi:bifunctional DNase/RNase